MTMKGFVQKVWCGVFSLLFLTGLVLFSSPADAQQETYEKALRAYQKKDFRTTVKYLTEYVERNPDAGAYYLLGYAHYKLKNRKEASEYFRQAYLVDPNFTPKAIDFGAGGK